jgi:hypothetical protein
MHAGPSDQRGESAYESRQHFGVKGLDSHRAVAARRYGATAGGNWRSAILYGMDGADIGYRITVIGNQAVIG